MAGADFWRVARRAHRHGRNLAIPVASHKQMKEEEGEEEAEEEEDEETEEDERIKAKKQTRQHDKMQTSKKVISNALLRGHSQNLEL